MTDRAALAALTAEIVVCRRCPRLVEWRERVAREKRAAFRDETYWGRPMKGFGDPAARVLLLGLAYKKNSGDARESPARRIATLLLDMGAEVRAADPHVVEGANIDNRVIRVGLTERQIADADAVVLLADHDAFDLDTVARRAGYVLDCRHRLAGPNVESL